MPEFIPIDELADGIARTTVAADPNKPHLVFGACPADGHTNPLLRSAQDMMARGFPATFIAGEEFEARVRAAGADYARIGPMFTPKSLAEREKIPAGIPRLQYDIKHAFLDFTAERWGVLKEVLARIRAEDPNRDIVVVPETAFMGHLPLLLGAPLPRGFTERPKVVCLHAVPYFATSVDTGPLGPGLPPDSTESGRARNMMLHQLMVAGPYAEMIEYQDRIHAELGCTEQPEHNTVFHHWVALPDRTLQMCPPSLEYPRCDVLPNIRFVGCPPPKPVARDYEYPEWWDEVTSGQKRLVTVTQGTVARVYSDLMLPTLSALGDREDLLVVAILGSRGAKLPEGAVVPPNVRVVDFLPYDAILPHTDVFVMNAGYGGMLHGMTNGVPMVLAGASEDKPEVSMRAEVAGIAVNLRTGTPSVDQIREGVDRVLADDRFKVRVDEIRRENEAMNAYDRVEKELMAVLEKVL